MSPSWALLTIMQMTPPEHEVVILNENVKRLDPNCEVDLVGITVTLDVMPRALEIAKQFRKRGIPVVAGGIHVTCCPESCIQHFDAICIGPAERVWKKIIADVTDHCLHRCYHDTKGFRGSEIVSPNYNSLELNKYLFSNIVLTSRGCPNRCDFCYNSCYNRLYVRRPISDVLRDIRAIKTGHVLFVDDNFIGDMDYTKELLKSMRPMKYKWGAAVTADIVDYPDMLDLMAMSGCQCLFIGFESVNHFSLQYVNKNNKVKKYNQVVQAIHSHGIMINASMVFGLDGDEPDVFKKTLNWLVKNKISTLTSHIMTPYPGTELYRRLDKADRITDYDLTKYNTANVVFKPKNMSPDELHQGYLWMYKQFYSFKNIIRRLPDDKAMRAPYLMFNLFYRKFGRFTSALSRLFPMRIIGKAATKISYRL